MAAFARWNCLLRTTTARRTALRQVSTKEKQLILTETHGQILMIGINRPEVRNCVNPETSRQLIDAFRQFEKEDSLVAVLYGHGGVFCSGYDLKYLSQLDMSVTDLFKPPAESDSAPMGPSRMLCSKPVVAAVAGYAVGGGLELACMCDLRVVEESAIMGVFSRRFGVPLLDGGTVRLPQLIGLSRALDLILTGRPLSAKEALQFGLANRVVATGAALGQAVQLAKEIAKHPQLCVQADRQSAYYSTFDAKNTLDAFQFEFQNGSKVLEESVEGAKRFASGIGRHGNFNTTKSKL